MSIIVLQIVLMAVAFHYADKYKVKQRVYAWFGKNSDLNSARRD